MSPSKTTVALVLSVFALAAIPPSASQPTPDEHKVDGTDLRVIRVFMTTDGQQDHGVVNKAGILSIIVRNMGRQDFRSQTGWQLVIGLDNIRNCPLDETPTGTATVCTKRFGIENATANNIPSGGEILVQFDWTPDPRESWSHVLNTSIENYGAGCQQTPPVNCQSVNGVPPGPDSEQNRANNFDRHAIFIKAPAVQAVADRDIAPEQDGIHRPWKYVDITQDCPKTQSEVARAGCKAQPGSIVTWAFNVKNLGNALDDFTPEIVEPGDPNNLTNRGYTYNFTPRTIRLDVNQTGRVLLHVGIPAAEQANNATNVNVTTATVQWRSSIDRTVTSNKVPNPPCDSDLEKTGVCQNPIFPSMVVGVKHGLNATTNESYHQANVSVPLTYNITLNNTGNFVDIFRVVIENETAQINSTVDGDWKPTYDHYIEVPAFDKRVWKLTMVPPREAVKGIHHFNVTLQSAFDSEAKTRQTLRFVADLQQKFGISGTYDTSLLRVLPAQKASYQLHIKNDGNGPDNVTLRFENRPPGNWNVQLSSETVSVPPHGSVPVWLNVTPPENTIENFAWDFFVNATSQGPHDVGFEQRPRWPFKTSIVVLRGPNIAVAPSLRTSFIDPGATQDYDLTVRNTGNLPDKFTVTLDRPADQLAWGATVTPAEVQLAPQTEAKVKVRLTAPVAGEVGETTRVFVNVRSTYDETIFNQTTLEGRVSGPDLFVESVAVNASNPYSGDALQLNVVLGNKGNKAPERNATLKLYFVASGVPRPIGERTFAASELPGGRRITETLTWDTSTAEGAGVILARLDEDAVVSEIDETNNEASRATTLRTALDGSTLRIIAPQPLSGLPGERVSYTEAPHVFQIQYNGNQPSEPVDIVVTSENGWGNARLSLALPRGSLIPVLVDLQVPQIPGVAKDKLRLTVTPTLRPQTTFTAETETTVVDTEKPLVLGVSVVPPSVKLGEPITLQANVVDATGLSSVRAFVVTPGNETQSFLLQPAGGNVWSHRQSFALAGTYRLYVEAIDGSQNANKNSTRDTLRSFNITPGSAPVIALADGQASAVRTGALVRFNITDPLGVARATYSIQGISYELPRPFQIDTSPFPSGTVELTVVAENIYGVQSTARFTLTIDNTPPGIRQVRLDPPSPRANEDATLRIETDAEVDSVQVAIKKEGQVVDTRTATRRGAGVFELLINAGQGDYAIDVTAKDLAGNARVQEGAVRFSAKPGSPFDVPAPGALLVLAAVAVGAALAARRRPPR